MEAVLKIEKLNKRFGGIVIADELSLQLEAGSVTGIYGDNGSGKSTLFNLISGFEHPDSGSIDFEGKNITSKSVLQRSRMGMGRLFQSPRLFASLTVMDNLLASGQNKVGHKPFNYFIIPRSIRKEEEAKLNKARQILEAFSLGEKAGNKAFELSVGEKKLLSLGSLLMNESSLILLDELSSGLNNVTIEKLITIFKTVSNPQESTFLNFSPTIVMIEHNSNVLGNLCGKILKLENGKLTEK